MKRMLLLLAFCAAACAQDGFQPLFNGKNLDGWDGEPGFWRVENGAIVGETGTEGRVGRVGVAVER